MNVSQGFLTCCLCVVCKLLRKTLFIKIIKICHIFIESYSEARNKFKKAEMNSGVNTDTDNKTKRKIRARKQIDNDERDDDDDDSDPSYLLAYPKAPMVYKSK